MAATPDTVHWRGVNHPPLIPTHMDATVRFWHGVPDAPLAVTLAPPRPAGGLHATPPSPAPGPGAGLRRGAKKGPPPPHSPDTTRRRDQKGLLQAGLAGEDRVEGLVEHVEGVGYQVIADHQRRQEP